MNLIRIANRIAKDIKKISIDRDFFREKPSLSVNKAKEEVDKLIREISDKDSLVEQLTTILSEQLRNKNMEAADATRKYILGELANLRDNEDNEITTKFHSECDKLMAPTEESSIINIEEIGNRIDNIVDNISRIEMPSPKEVDKRKITDYGTGDVKEFKELKEMDKKTYMGLVNSIISDPPFKDPPFKDISEVLRNMDLYKDAYPENWDRTHAKVYEDLTYISQMKK